MACINRSLPGYKELKEYFGQSLADSIIRNNKMEIPDIETASKMVKGQKVLQFKKALNYLRTTVSSSVDDLIANMPRIIQKKGSALYVLKGSRLSEQPSPGAKSNVEGANISFLEKVNESFGNIFNIKPYYENPQAVYIRNQIFTAIQNLDKVPTGVFVNAREFAADPAMQDDLLKALTDQLQTAGNAEVELSAQLSSEIVALVQDYISFTGTKQVKAGSKLFNAPNPETAIIAQDYKDEKGIDVGEGDKIYSINTDYAKKIADAFEAMEHAPNDPIVKAAYEAMVQETIDQFEAIQKAGYKVEVFTGEGEPYKSSEAMIADVTYNKHMFIFATEAGFGQDKIKTDTKPSLSITVLNKIPKGGTNQEIYAPDYYNKIKNSIKEEGIKEPIVLRYYVKDNALRVQDGHHRLKIANELGLKDVPVTINVVWGSTIKEGNEDIKGQELYHPPTKLDVEGYNKRNYAPSNVSLEELGFLPSDTVAPGENPLLEDSGFKDINGKPLLVNDLFRFVHDFFGHSERGNGFGAVGEENAWDVHARMYTPLARRAMTTETRGQNSWVNFGPQMRTSKSATPYNKGETLKAMQKFVDLSKNKKFANVADFAKDIFPSDVYEKYKNLYELAIKHKLIVDVEPGSMQRVGGGVYSALASWGAGSINIDPSTIFTYVTNWDDLADVLNHEIIHGLLSRGLRASTNAEFNIHNELTPVFKNIISNFDKASDGVKETLSYIIDTSREYSGIRDFSEGSDKFDDRPSVENLEELITYAFTDVEFAKFLDTIPAITNNEESKTLTVWGQLKQILRNFINNITGKTALDDINSVLDKYFNVEASVIDPKTRLFKSGEEGYLNAKQRPFAEQKIGLLPEEFSTLPEDQGQERTGTKIADGTFRVTIDEQKLTDLVEENKKNPTEVPFEDNIPDEQYQKASYSEWHWRSEQEKRFVVENIVRMLNKKFNIPFEYVNDASLPWSAKFSKGKIVLNLAKIGVDSAFHEIAHPFVEMLKNENPELYNALINELKSSEEGQKEIERVAKEYSELSPQEQLDEALVSLIGKNSSNQFLNSTETSPKKSLIQRFWDWVKDVFFNMGMDASTFSPTMTINDIASMISNPMFSIDLSRSVDLNNRDEYYQKKATQQMQRDFDALINDTIAKLKADVNIVGKTEEENKRKYFSSKQVESLTNDRKDINALNSFITSGLFNLKDINDRFNEFITKYEAKGTKSKEDIRNLSLLLNEIEDNITLYGNAGPLLESVFEMFPDEKDNFADWAYSLKREKRLMNEYQSWGVNVVTDWLFPYQKKAVRKALASNNLFSVVSKEVYDNEVKLAAEEGITDRGIIIDRAVKQEIRNTLLIAKRDASGITGYLAGVLNSRDSIASTVGQAIMDELHKALTYGQSVEAKFKKLMKQYRGSSVFSSNAVEKEFYQKYLRKVKVWTYQGLGVDAKPKYEYKEHTAFHEEYEWDNFYNAKREFFDKLGPVPSKTDLAAYRKYKAARDGWFAQNTVITKDQNGKDARIPSPKYKNAQFGVLQSDPLFKEMYNTYKLSNNKLGKQGLRYGIVPQLSNAVVDIKGFKPKNALEGIRNWIGEQEQVYFVQSIAGGEKPVVPINHVRLLDEKDLSYNLINSVSKFATSTAKYESMSMLEPQVQILKNFIGGNNALNIKKRRTIKRSASGIKALSRIIHDDMYVDSTKLNNQLNSFLNDAVYGQSMKKEVVQMWDSKFEVFKTNDTSMNGGPKVETLHGFENVREFTGLNDLDYSGFEFGKDRKVGEWTIKMTKKDWNFSVKKTADRLGLLTALQTMIVNPISATVNIIRGKSEVFVESLGGRYYNMKDYAFGEKEYWKAIGSGDFFEDLKGGKPSFLSSMLIDYDALQGELIDASGRTLERGLINKFFRTHRLFFAQNGGEHYIQTQLMIAMMNHQKVKITGGETISLFEARKREFNGQLKMSDTNWKDDNNREFRETLNEVNTRLNGNYNKTDKAMIQRTWWGSAIMMFRKHIYNGLANRYRKGYVNYQTGNYTEGYWRQFAHGLIREIGEMARDRTIRKFNLNEQEKYAFKKFGGDIAMLMLFIAAFKMFDDDDDDNEFTDSTALIFRRLVSESGQYTPIIAPLEAGKIAKNPSAISHTINNFYEAFKQTLADPTEEYERNGPGYEDGDNKAWKKWQRVIPGWRIVLNTSEPERLLQFYQQNSLGFLKPSAGKENEEETGNQ